jgi:oxygen-dependent protoporphyrinogen oxidase
LAAAWELRHDAEVTVFEPDRLGGRIRTTPFAGRMVDEGPDAFITRQPHAVDLCRELGLEPELVAPQAGKSLLWWRGRLRALPEGLMMGVPTDIRTLLGSGILSPVGLGRAALEPVLPRTRAPEQLSVRELVGRRFGWEVADRLVDPLVGGISAGWTGELGAAEMVPQLVEATRRNRSLLLGLRRAAPSVSDPGRPLFLSLGGGLGRLVDVLVESLRSHGVKFVPTAVSAVAEGGDGRVAVTPFAEEFDGAVVAAAAPAAARLLFPGARAAAEGRPALADLPTSSVALVTASLSGGPLPEGFNGFLVPRGAGLLMTACSFGSNKWPHWAEPGRSLVRISCGRRGDTRLDDLDDDALTTRLIAELGECLGRRVLVTGSRVSRWPDSFPQYRPGHGDAVRSFMAQVEKALPTVRLAGSSYHGIGIPACIGSGRQAAESVRAALLHEGRPPSEPAGRA